MILIANNNAIYVTGCVDKGLHYISNTATTVKELIRYFDEVHHKKYKSYDEIAQSEGKVVNCRLEFLKWIVSCERMGCFSVCNIQDTHSNYISTVSMNTVYEEIDLIHKVNGEKWIDGAFGEIRPSHHSLVIAALSRYYNIDKRIVAKGILHCYGDRQFVKIQSNKQIIKVFSVYSSTRYSSSNDIIVSNVDANNKQMIDNGMIFLSNIRNNEAKILYDYFLQKKSPVSLIKFNPFAKTGLGVL